MRKFEGFQKGVNLGGWISQFADYDYKHFDTFITEEDIKYIASLGFDHVRVPVDYNVLEDENGVINERGFEYLEKCYRWCHAHGLHMLLDLHECYGYSFDPLKADMDREVFFYDEKLQDRFLNLWKEIAIRFKDYPDEVAFEPLNEIVIFDVAEAWNKVAAKWIKTIREICPRHYLVIGSVCYSSVLCVKLLDPPADDHIVYNFHCYEPLIFTHQGAYWIDVMPADYRVTYPQPLVHYHDESKAILGRYYESLEIDGMGMTGPDFFEAIFKEGIEAAEQYDVPLYCGEYGVIDLADNPSKIRWLTDIHTVFDRHGIGRALWNYKEKDFGFVDERFAEIKEDFIKCL